MDITVDIQHRSPAGRPARRVPRVPWSPRAWGQAISLAGGIPVQLAPWLIPFLLIRWAQVSSGGRWQWQGWLLWYLVTAVVMLLFVPLFTRVQRHRLRAVGVVIPPQPKRPGLLRPGGITAALRAQSTWRQVTYHVLAAPALAGAGEQRHRRAELHRVDGAEDLRGGPAFGLREDAGAFAESRAEHRVGEVGAGFPE
jgi:hypothetical protein